MHVLVFLRDVSQLVLIKHFINSLLQKRNECIMEYDSNKICTINL